MIPSLLKYDSHFHIHYLVCQCSSYIKTQEIKCDGKWKKKKTFSGEKQIDGLSVHGYNCNTEDEFMSQLETMAISLGQHNTIYFSIVPVQELWVMLDEYFSMDLI